MRIQIKTTAKFLDNIRNDLERPHPFAAERVGFVTTKIYDGVQFDRVVVLSRYLPVPNDEYVLNDQVGAEVGQTAVRRMLGEILSSREGVMHVHMHDNTGIPRLSDTDVVGLSPMIQGFQNLSIDVANGILLLSRDALDAWMWLKGQEPKHVIKISVTGYPMQMIGGMNLDI